MIPGEEIEVTEWYEGDFYGTAGSRGETISRICNKLIMKLLRRLC